MHHTRVISMVYNFKWYHPVRAVRIGPTVYRYMDSSLSNKSGYSATVVKKKYLKSLDRS